MFGLTKNPPQANNSSTNPNPPTGFNIEEAPIHTMQDDLKSLKNPTARHELVTAVKEDKKPETIPQPIAPQPAVPRPVTPQKQSNSPFLNLADKNPLTGIILSDEKPQSTDNLINKIIKETKPLEKNTPTPFGTPQRNFNLTGTTKLNMPYRPEISPEIIKQTNTPHHNWGRLFFYLILIIAIALISWIGYDYYQKNKKVVSPPPISIPETEPIQPPIDQPTPKPALTYSETNPNYLRLESLDLATEKAKGILKQYADQVGKEGYIAPVEFIITDTQNKPIGFKSFSNLLGINFSPTLMALLGDNFSLYIYNDITAPKIGLSIESRDDINLTKVLLSEEKNLADEISPIFFTSEYHTEKSFDNSEYKTAKVRFQNIISPDMLSVDYTAYKNKLLIGTTKLTLRSMIDKINGVKTETVTSQDLGPKEAYLKMKIEADSINSYADMEAYLLKHGSKAQIAKLAENKKQVDDLPQSFKDQVVTLAKGPSSSQISNIQETITGDTAILNVSTSDIKMNGTVNLVKEDGQWKIELESWVQK